MTREKLFLLDVLKAFVHNEKLNFDVELDWAELMRLSTIHSVTGIFGYMAMSNPCERIEPMLPQLKTQCLGTIALFAQRTEKAKQLLDKLSEADIDIMRFKGYVLRDYYPVPELRTFGDVDVLIKPQDRETCHQLMLEQGFSVKTDWEPVYSYYKNADLYELHTELMEVDVSDKADYKGYFRNVWEHAMKTGEHTYEPIPEFHFIYLLTHIAKHINGAGAGIRMYLDLAFFIKHFGDGVDWSYVEAELESIKLRDFANFALTVTEKCLGIASPIELKSIENEVFEDFMEYTMDGGVFGHVGRDHALVTLKKSDDTSRMATVMRRLFPKADTIERRYTYLQGNHWLLPAAWVHRFFKTSGSLAEHANEAKSIMQTDDEEVRKLKKIYKEIGL